jgi:hypothetical protein
MNDPIFEPFETIFLRRRDELTRLVGMTATALRGTNGLERLTRVLNKDDADVEAARRLEQAAQAELTSELPILHSAATVLIWGALETAVRDFVVRWLLQNPTSRQAAEFKNIRIRLLDYEMLDGEERMRYLLGVIEQELGAPLKPGVGRFMCLLKPLGIVPAVSDEERRTLNELAAVRNVIVHKAGIVDGRLLELCPWIPVREGEALQIGFSQFSGYVRVASFFVASIVGSARTVQAVRSAEV